MTEEKIPTPTFIKVIFVIIGLGVTLWGVAMTTGGSGNDGWGGTTIPPGLWMVAGAIVGFIFTLTLWGAYERGWKDRRRVEPSPATNPPPFRG